MRLTKDQALKLIPELTREISRKAGNYINIIIMSDEQLKSNKQNNLFHGLLQCFFDSDCSSFESLEDMRNHYKEIAGLIKRIKDNSLKKETKKVLWNALKFLPIPKDEKDKICHFLKGYKEKELSWSEATKDQAKYTLDRILKDMDLSGVIGSKMGNKYQEILKGIEK